MSFAASPDSLGTVIAKQRRLVRRRNNSMKQGVVVARLTGMKRIAHRALAGDSNDAEHDALYEVEATVDSLTPDVRRMVQALRLCVKLLESDEIRRRAERHRYSLWRAAVSSGRVALG